jgi:hypothetical protein
METDYIGVGEAARITNARTPKDVSELFYQGDLRTDICPVISGRRLIPRSYLDNVRAALKRRGWMKAQVVAHV